jgi:hypothetical protein
MLLIFLKIRNIFLNFIIAISMYSMNEKFLKGNFKMTGFKREMGGLFACYPRRII